MKRLIAAITLLLSAVSFAVIGYFQVCNKIDAIVLLMQQDREITMKTSHSSAERTAQITEEWEKNETFLVSILPHSEIEEIEIGILCLNDYNKQGFAEEYIKTLNECINSLNHLKTTEKPDIKNIF